MVLEADQEQRTSTLLVSSAPRYAPSPPPLAELLARAGDDVSRIAEALVRSYASSVELVIKDPTHAYLGRRKASRCIRESNERFEQLNEPAEARLEGERLDFEFLCACRTGQKDDAGLRGADRDRRRRVQVGSTARMTASRFFLATGSEELGAILRRNGTVHNQSTRSEKRSRLSKTFLAARPRNSDAHRPRQRPPLAAQAPPRRRRSAAPQGPGQPQDRLLAFQLRQLRTVERERRLIAAVRLRVGPHNRPLGDVLVAGAVVEVAHRSVRERGRCFSRATQRLTRPPKHDVRVGPACQSSCA